MRTKKEIVAIVANNNAVLPSGIVIPAPEVSYLKRASLSGNPLLKTNAATRVYENDRVNGTSFILLGVIGAIAGIKEKTRIVTGEEFKAAFTALRNVAFKEDTYRAVEKNYSRFGGNSSSPEKKIGPVVTGLIREVKNGNLSGFNPEKIGSIEARSALGYKY